MSTNGLLITKSNVKELTPALIHSFSTKDHWHKFFLENGGIYDMEIVLDALLDLINPFDLVPVKYTISGKNSFFLARNCGQAIEKLCLNLMPSLKLRGVIGEVNLSIEICHTPTENLQVNMQFHLRKVVQKRWEESSKTVVDLTNFSKEPELCEVFYCPLSRPKFLLYVLCVIKRITTVTSINLSNNNITDIKPFAYLKNYPELICLDLSQNKIENIKLCELLGRTSPNLQEINLNRNPICSKFKTEKEYLNWIKMNLPNIKKIDGISLYYGIPNQQIFLCQKNYWRVINSFLQHYFTLYDNNRQALEQTYDKNALFSMTITCWFSDILKDSNLKVYESKSRKLLKVNKNINIVGACQSDNASITKVLLQLPFTEHDPYSFKVDVLMCQESLIILMVSGVFRDFEVEPRYKSFNRTFALKKVANDEYKIVNDLFYLTTATDEEISNSFAYGKPPQEKRKVFVNKEEEQKIIETVSKLTEMNSAYSRKCLEDCDWDVKQALEVFVKNYQTFSIPQEAFDK